MTFVLSWLRRECGGVYIQGRRRWKEDPGMDLAGGLCVCRRWDYNGKFVIQLGRRALRRKCWRRYIYWWSGAKKIFQTVFFLAFWQPLKIGYKWVKLVCARNFSKLTLKLMWKKGDLALIFLMHTKGGRFSCWLVGGSSSQLCEELPLSDLFVEVPTVPRPYTTTTVVLIGINSSDCVCIKLVSEENWRYKYCFGKRRKGKNVFFFFLHAHWTLWARRQLHMFRSVRAHIPKRAWWLDEHQKAIARIVKKLTKDFTFSDYWGILIVSSSTTKTPTPRPPEDRHWIDCKESLARQTWQFRRQFQISFPGDLPRSDH